MFKSRIFDESNWTMDECQSSSPGKQIDINFLFVSYLYSYSCNLFLEKLENLPPALLVHIYSCLADFIVFVRGHHLCERENSSDDSTHFQ